jgi:hypothetical protein
MPQMQLLSPFLRAPPTGSPTNTRNGRVSAQTFVLGADRTFYFPFKTDGLWFRAAACVAVGLYAFISLITIPKREIQITPENSETVIRGWLENLRLSSRVLSAPERSSDVIFSIEIRFQNGNPVDVQRLKSLDRYIVLGTNVYISSEHQAMWNQAGKEADSEIADELTLEMSRARLEFSANLPTVVTVLRRVPINGLTEGVFLQDVDDMDDAILLTRSALRLAIQRAAQTAVQKGKRPTG